MTEFKIGDEVEITLEEYYKEPGSGQSYKTWIGVRGTITGTPESLGSNYRFDVHPDDGAVVGGRQFMRMTAGNLRLRLTDADVHNAMESIKATIERTTLDTPIGVPRGYAESAFFPGEKYYILYDHERKGYAVYADADPSFA